MVETLGEALDLSWRIHMRCLDDGREGLKHKRRCDFRCQLDLQTLVCTRGRDFPLARIAGRPRCVLPAGRRDVRTAIELRRPLSEMILCHDVR